MGNQPDQHTFIQDQWQLIEKNIMHSVWRNRQQPNIHIEGHDRFSTDKYTYHTDKEIFQLRHNNPYLVAGVFLQQHEQHEFCSTNYKYRLFIEKIPIRLTDIEHIPFPDILHLYNQSLNGFQLLARKLGYFFEVEESYIGINERGVVKVWLSKYFANSTSIGGKISEEQMVKSIIDIVDKNSDPYQISKSLPTIRNYLYRNADTLQFAEAKRQLHSYITTYHNGIIPHRLDCVEQAGGVYAIANRPQIYHSQQSTVGQPFHPELTTQNPRLQASKELNRPKLASNIYISKQEHISYNSHQNVEYVPLTPVSSVPNQSSLKASETFHPVPPPRTIVNPVVQMRQNVEVSRRRKSDFEQLYLQYPGQPSQNNMKYSQTLQKQMPLQSRQVNFVRNVPVSIPVQNDFQVPPISANQNVPVPAISGGRIDFGIRRPSHNSNPGDSNQQITFKQLNQNGQLPSLPISGNPSIQISGNSSMKFSPAPSLINSHRGSYPSNAYIQDQARTISQQSVPAPVTPSQSSPAHSKNNSLFSINEKTLNQNIPVSYPSNYSNQFQVESKKKQVSFSPSLYQQKTQLLASFNPAYTNKNFVFETQKPIEKQYVPEKTIENDYTYKKPNQINADDGKSSQEFMRKLRQINSTYGKTQDQPSKPSIPIFDTPITYTNNTYNHNFFDQQGNLRSYQQIGAKTPVATIMQVDDELFGRNAVSNIIQTSQNSYKNINSFTNNEPLKFQQGLTMKYSRLEADQPEPLQFRKSAFGAKYEAKIDSDLLADLNRLKN